MIKKLVTAATLGLMATTATAQDNCGQYERLAERMASKYGESVQSTGIAGREYFMEIWANSETGTWSFVVIDPSGVACMMASGENFEVITFEPLSPMGKDM